jgi:hypothetical protein
MLSMRLPNVGYKPAPLVKFLNQPDASSVEAFVGGKYI